MGLGCGMSMVKYLLFIFNLICALCGIAIIAVGTVILVRIEDFSEGFKDHNITWSPIALIVLGSIIFLIAFFGCCGAIRESHCMTITYSSILMILLLAKIVIAVYIFVNVDEFTTAIGKTFDTIWQSGKSNPEDKTLNAIQSALECCGSSNALEWIPNTPVSCCSESNLTVGSCLAINAYPIGCRARVLEFTKTSGNLLAAIALGVAGVELIGFIFACCLANSIRNNKRRYA